TCAGGVTSPDLKMELEAAARRCVEGAVELQMKIRSLGGEPAAFGTVAGALHRAWTDIVPRITGLGDRAVLDECKRGEDVAKQAYEEALVEDLPADVEAIVRRRSIGQAPCFSLTLWPWLGLLPCRLSGQRSRFAAWNQTAPELLTNSLRGGRHEELVAIMGFLAAVAAVNPANARPGGCVKGAIVGGIVGHFTGHTGVGAATGCAYGLHQRHQYDRRQEGRSNY